MTHKMSPHLVVKDVQLLPIMSAATYLFGIVLAYLMAMGMDHVEPIFPFISHVVAYPPQVALGAIFGSVGALLGILSLILRYVVIDHRGRILAQDNKQSVQTLNKAALWFGILSNICILMVMLSPVGFPWNEKYDLMLIVAIPHHLADLGVLVFFSMYVSIEAYLTFVQRTINKENVSFQIALVLGVLISVCGILLTVYSAIMEIISTIVDEETRIVHFIYKKYSVTAAICAFSEWLFVVICFVFVATFYRDFKNVNIEFHLKPKK